MLRRACDTARMSGSSCRHFPPSRVSVYPHAPHTYVLASEGRSPSFGATVVLIAFATSLHTIPGRKFRPRLAGAGAPLGHAHTRHVTTRTEETAFHFEVQLVKMFAVRSKNTLCTNITFSKIVHCHIWGAST
jgi:hypothetical protein